MRKNMKDIIFQLDIRDMACLELSDGMSLFFFANLFFFLPCYRLVLVSSSELFTQVLEV
jgi:hypothetical protein